MRKRNNPTLFDWAIVRISLRSHPEVAWFHFTGIGFGHPRLQDFFQFVTTDIQEISEDGTWGRSRSRVYNLERPLNQDEFTPELEAEIKDILQQEIGRACDVEWVSIEDWRAMKAGEGSSKRQVIASAGSHTTPHENDAASMSDEEVDAILAAARKRGEELQKSMIAQAGPFLSTTEAAKAAGLSPDELERRMNVSLLAVPMEGGVGWPHFQFENPATMAGIGKVMKRLDIDSPWMQLNFFLMHLEELNGIRPIDAIRRGLIRAAEIAASHFGTHGAS